MSPADAARSRAIDAAVLGRRLRNHRHAAGKTQGELAGATGISAAYISRIENGARRPSPSLLDRIAAALGTSARAILQEPPANRGAPSPAEVAANATSTWLRTPSDPETYRAMLQAVQEWRAVTRD